MNTGADFLRKLDAELRSTTTTAPDRFGYSHHVDHYTKKRLTEAELEKVLEIVEKEELILYPTTTTFGFSKAFEVFSAYRVYPDVPSDYELLLKWQLDQSPEGWTWKKMSQHFTKAETLAFFGLPLVRKESDYDY